jgi:hypothetical protein
LLCEAPVPHGAAILLQQSQISKPAVGGIRTASFLASQHKMMAHLFFEIPFELLRVKQKT